MSLGQRIASMRGYRRISQEVLAGMVGVSKQTISNWEREYRIPDANDIRKLCLALGCTADYLLEMTDQPNAKWR